MVVSAMRPMSIFQFFEQLNETGIAYCQFKSTEHLNASFDGKTDFDLLVSPQDASRFNQLLFQWGFKQRYAHKDSLYPGTENYLWYDVVNQQMHHLHVHYRLIFGEKGFKNYRWKVESDFIENAILHPDYPLKIAPLYLELPLLIIRSILKHRNNIDKKLPDDLTRELMYLISQLPDGRLAGIAVSNDLYGLMQTFVDEFNADTLSPMTLNDYKTQLMPLLKCWQRYTDEELSTFVNTSVDSAKLSRWLSNSGCQIAIIGADGAGKSTLVSDCEKWLNYKLEAKQFYLGQNKALTQQASKQSLLSSVFLAKKKPNQHILYAQHRKEMLLAGQSFASAGGVALYDRYPLKEFHTMPLPMDGPRLKEDETGYQEEQQIYQLLPDYPDLLIVLKVDEAVAVKRKPENTEGRPRVILHDKIEAINQLCENPPEYCNLVVIDANQPYSDVEKHVKSIIWDSI